jgi:CheY-like chemotaxis protein
MPVDPDFTGVHVMLVDDNEDALNIFGSYVRRLGAVVTAARNGAEALGMLQQAQAHVIVTDLSMPGIDRLEFFTRLRGHRGEAESPTPVIAVTAFPDNYVRESMHELGVRSYLVKPVNPERVAREVFAFYQYTQSRDDGSPRR